MEVKLINLITNFDVISNVTFVLTIFDESLRVFACTFALEK